MMTDGGWEEKEASDPGKVQVPAGPLLLQLHQADNQADDSLPERMTIFEAVVWVATRDQRMVRAAVFSAGYLLDLAVPHGGPPAPRFGVETVAHSYLRPDVKGHYCVCGKADCTCVDDAAMHLAIAAAQGQVTFGDIPARDWAGATLKWDRLDASFTCGAGDLLAAFPPHDRIAPASTLEALSPATAAPTETHQAEPERSGVPGRPTSKHLVIAELERRAASGEMVLTVAGEAKALSSWLKQAQPLMPQMTPRSTENAIRDVHRRLKDDRPH